MTTTRKNAKPNVRLEEAISMRQAAELIPSLPCQPTMSRWSIYGIRGVVLETYKIGGKRYTSAPAVQRFLDACAAADGCPQEADADCDAAVV